MICICSFGADPGCRICSPEKWEEYSPDCWRVKEKKEMEHTKECLAGGECNCAIKKENEMDEQQPKQDALQKRAEERISLPPANEIDKKNMGQEANAGMARDDSSTATRLLDKNWSPLIIRKYQMEGWPMYIGIICDANLNDLDDTVYDIMDEAEALGFVNGKIQGVRNTCGLLGDRLVAKYNKVKRGVAEGVIVCWYVDKLFCSSAYGDFMTHNKCAMEFYSMLQMLPHI